VGLIKFWIWNLHYTRRRNTPMSSYVSPGYVGGEVLKIRYTPKFPLWTEGYLNNNYTPNFRLVIINTNSLLHNQKYICAATLSQSQPQVLAPYPVGVGAVPGLIAPRPSFQRSSMRCSRLSIALVSCMWCLGYLMDDHSR